MGISKGVPTSRFWYNNYMTSEEELELIRQASMDARLGKNIEQYFTKAEDLFASDAAYDILCDINGLLNQINTLKKRQKETGNSQ